MTEEEPVYLHCDVDKMYYSVEALETPSLADDLRAVVIGHDPKDYPRGIVTTANGLARELGITSGLSIALATRIAHEPGLELVVGRPRHAAYGRYSPSLTSPSRHD